MKMPTWKLAFALVLVVPAFAAHFDFSFHYDKLTLKTGRELRNVTLKGYTTQTGKVDAVMGRQLATFRLGEFPAEVVARINQVVPAQTPEEIKEEKAQSADERKAAKRRVQTLERGNLAAAKADRDAQRHLDVKKAEAAIDQESQVQAKVAIAAKTFASHYFRYEADPNSSKGYVFDSNVLLDDPEPVPGWTNRWRVRGKVGIQYLTRNIGSVGRETKDFEILIDAPPGATPKRVDISMSF